MAIIKNTKETAEDIATKIYNSSKKLSTDTSVSRDSQTTILGNMKAKDAIRAENEIAKEIAELIFDAGNKISSVCKEFQRKDDELGEALGNTSISGKGFSINE